MERIIIIPAFRPDKYLKQIVRRNWELENQMIVVDDGSGQEYRPLFEESGEKCIVLHHEENRGKREAIKTALQYIKEELWECGVIGIMDADGQHLPEDMDRLLIQAGLNPGALVLGTRTIDETMPFKSRMGNRITCRIFQLMTGVAVSDTQTGLRAFSAELLDFMSRISGSRYEYEMNMLASCAKKGIPIREVPIRTIYHDKENSCSHFRRIRDSVRIYRELFKFFLSSFFSFLLDYGLFCLLVLLFPRNGWSVLAANVGARLISAAYNYTVNCRFVFHEKGKTKTAAGYAGLALFILILNNWILQLYAGVFRLPVYTAKIMTELTLFLISWMVQRQMIFERKRKPGICWKESGREA